MNAKPMMPPMFHGTSLAAAREIIAAGPRGILDDLGIPAFVRKALCHVEAAVGSGRDLELVFDDAGVEEWIARAHTVRSVAAGRDDGLFAYGDIYVDLNLVIATSYAQAGSEILGCMRDLRQVVRKVASHPEEVLDGFPRLWAAVDTPANPVVLKLVGVSVDSLRDWRTGVPVTEADFATTRSLLDLPGAPLTFRLVGLQPRMIDGYYDLAGWEGDVEQYRRGIGDLQLELGRHYRPATELLGLATGPTPA